MSSSSPPEPTVGRLRRDALGSGAIAFLVVAAAAPLTVMAGVAPLAILVGGIGAPVGYLAAGVVLTVFAVGVHGHDPAHRRRRAPSTPTSRSGLGRPAGMAPASWPCLLQRPADRRVRAARPADPTTRRRPFTGVDRAVVAVRGRGDRAGLAVGRRGIDVGRPAARRAADRGDRDPGAAGRRGAGAGRRERAEPDIVHPVGGLRPGHVRRAGLQLRRLHGLRVDRALPAGGARPASAPSPAPPTPRWSSWACSTAWSSGRSSRPSAASGLQQAAGADPAALFFVAIERVRRRLGQRRHVHPDHDQRAGLADRLPQRDQPLHASTWPGTGSCPAGSAAPTPAIRSPSTAGIVAEHPGRGHVMAVRARRRRPVHRTCCSWSTPRRRRHHRAAAAHLRRRGGYFARRAGAATGRPCRSCAGVVSAVLLAAAHLWCWSRNIDLLTGAAIGHQRAAGRASCPLVLAVGAVVAAWMRRHRPAVLAASGTDPRTATDAATSLPPRCGRTRPPQPEPHQPMNRVTADLIVLADRCTRSTPHGARRRPPRRWPCGTDSSSRSATATTSGTGAGRQTEVIDLGPATLTPGLVDGHIHPVIGAAT